MFAKGSYRTFSGRLFQNLVGQWVEGVWGGGLDAQGYEDLNSMGVNTSRVVEV